MTLSGALSPELQKGMTADAIRQTVTWCADQAGDVAETNDTISTALGFGHDWASDLNSRLTPIAEDVSSRIKQIQSSKEPAAAKLGHIVDAVMEGLIAGDFTLPTVANPALAYPSAA
ncbi:hypothetical protein [Mycobacterium sp.]|uniref:hypothetical protein n=1 Tax=Mycobacterium sp. TaxID=1785 RepID=UPI0012843846|nr:hypothetical protein [Mycobacterium sp.]KAA8961595.1 MAG: hypothetical protein F6Q13_12635 [Mycobacterium sp.]